jgi:hypothetical protein
MKQQATSLKVGGPNVTSRHDSEQFAPCDAVDSFAWQQVVGEPQCAEHSANAAPRSVGEQMEIDTGQPLIVQENTAFIPESDASNPPQNIITCHFV